MLEKGVCGLIGEDEIFRVQSMLLLNGLFGVPKDPKMKTHKERQFID